MARISYIPVAELGRQIQKAGLPPDCLVWVATKSELHFGRSPEKTEFIFDLGNEMWRAPREGKAPAAPPVSQPIVIQSNGRKSGRFVLELFGSEFILSNLKDVVRVALTELAKRHSGFLDQLSREKPRSKRIVAQSKNDLFEDAELVKKYAAPLTGGWWFGTNNSEAEVKRWLQRMARVAGAAWGKDVIFSKS